MGYAELFVTVMIYGVLGFGYLKYHSEQKKTTRSKIIRKSLCFFFLLNTLSLVVFVLAEKTSKVENGAIERNVQGEGEKKEEVLVSVEGMCEEIPMVINVSEKGYTQEEMEKILVREADKLGSRILGENKSRSHVSKDLHLPSDAEGLPVTIQWEQDSYKYMETTGELKEDIPEKGQKVHLTAVLTFHQGGERTAQRTWETDVMLYPPDLENKEEVLEELRRRIEKEDETGLMGDALVLPEEVDGRKVEWTKKKQISGYHILGIGSFAFLLFFWARRQKEEEKRKQRKDQLISDYPEILEQFCLLIGAGMTVKGAWLKIVGNYQERKKEMGIRPAYEEMERTCYEMQGGISEREGYENFGKRCQIQEYMRLGLLLSQNLKKGTRGLTELLSLEAIHAFEERKARARRKGEEAGTKLLAPMVMMLGIVLIIVVVPAFWSMGI